MKRDDVKKILPEITDEQLKELMKLHGSSVNGYKASAAKLEESLAERDERLKEFENIDLEKLKSDEYERAYSEAKSEFEQYKMSRAIDQAIKSSGARNLTAVKSLISMDKVGFENDTLTGLGEQLEMLVKENPYLFENGDSLKPEFTSQIEAGSTGITRDAFEKLGYRERLRLFNDNPTLYSQMNN